MWQVFTCFLLDVFNGSFSAEAATRERQSLLALRALVAITAETLLLWSTAFSHGFTQVSRGSRAVIFKRRQIRCDEIPVQIIIIR